MSTLLDGSTEEYADLPGLRMHFVTMGPDDGEPVLLLHGFPEFWYSWRHQMQALAQAGYRAIAPDQRGYNLSDKPKGIAYVFRLKKALPPRVHTPSEEKGEKGKFINKEVVFHFPEREEVIKRTDAVLEAMPGTEDDEPEEMAAPTLSMGNITIEKALMQILDIQDKQAKQMEVVMETIRLAVLSGKI